MMMMEESRKEPGKEMEATAERKCIVDFVVDL